MSKIYKYKNILLETIQKNNRKINAIIRRNQIHRIKVFVILLAIVISIFRPIFAIENNQINYGEYKIFCYKDPNMYVTYDDRPQPNYEYYYIKDNIDLPVYCLNLGMKGAEDKEDGYIVNANEKINDKTLQSIILNCYPYKSVEELKVNTKSQAKFASQFAIWIYLEGLSIDLIGAISKDNVCVVDAIKEIYNNGINNAENYQIDFKNQIGKQQIECINNKKYYTKKLYFDEIQRIDEIKVSTDDKNINIIQQENGYKICVPVENVNNYYTADISYNIKAKENIALLGISTIAGFQDVTITLKEFFNTDIKDKIEFEDTRSKVEIIKKDKDTNKPLKGVKYLIKDESYNVIGEYITDENGIITTDIFSSGNSKIYINELQPLPEYRIDNNIYEVSLKENDDIKLELYNEKKKGSIKITKKSKEYNEITDIKENMPLCDVSFYIYDINMNKIVDVTTNEFGYTTIKELPIGKYYIKEYKAPYGYKLLDELIEIEIVDDGDNVNVEILNENVEIYKKLPVTGM